jgi:hypothetical protein
MISQLSVNSSAEEKIDKPVKRVSINPPQHHVEPDQSVLNAETNGEPVKYKIDWLSLERSTQLMNLEHLRQDLNDDPQRFLVNQILLSVQFFKNFEK